MYSCSHYTLSENLSHSVNVPLIEREVKIFYLNEIFSDEKKVHETTPEPKIRESFHEY